MDTKATSTLEELIKWINGQINLDEKHTVVALFEDNQHDEIIGWTVVEIGVEGDYPIYEDLRELFADYCIEQTC